MDNIVIGTLLVPETDLGILLSETTLRFTIEELLNYNDELYLPHILKHCGLYKSVSEVKRIAKVRRASDKIIDPLSKELDRVITQPEFTNFKIGKNSFWLAVGKTIIT